MATKERADAALQRPHDYMMSMGCVESGTLSAHCVAPVNRNIFFLNGGSFSLATCEVAHVSSFWTSLRMC
jgi:hypothetical protein